MGGVPLPEAEEAIFTEFLKETERRRAVHIRVLYSGWVGVLEFSG